MSNKKDKKEDIIEEELSEDNENDGSINEAEIPEVEIEVITEANGSETININDKNTVIAEGAFSQLIPKIEILPDQLGIIAVQHRPLFPHMVIPLVVEGELYQKTLKIAQKSEPGYIGIVLSKDSFDLENQ